MPVVSSRLNLIYYDIPKVACTSLKTFFWETETGRKLPTYANLTLAQRVRARLGQLEITDIHYRPGYQTCSHARTATLGLPEGFARMTVLRDPIARLYSAWSNKASQAVFARRDELEDLRNEALPTSPGFGDYIDHFEKYRAVSRPVRVHTYPYSWHLGPDLAAYDHVFKVEEMAAVQDFLSGRLGRPVALPHSNSTSVPPQNAGLSPAQVDKLLEITRAEYDWLGGTYDQQDGLHRLMKKIKPGT